MAVENAWHGFDREWHKRIHPTLKDGDCLMCQIEMMDKELESLYNCKERMFDWKARAKLFARRIRAIKAFQEKTPTTYTTSYYSFLLRMELNKEMKG